jgi:hypothetical protein
MKGDHIKYTDGYKYQLSEDYFLQTTIKPEKEVNEEFIKLTLDGLLTVKEGYAWDGPSGPTIDTKSSMRGALVHDALYQLLRDEKISQSCRVIADTYLRDICIEDGMFTWRAHLWYIGVRHFAMSAANAEDVKPVIIAP